MDRERDVLFLYLYEETFCIVKKIPVIEMSLVLDVILETLHLIMNAYLSVKT